MCPYMDAYENASVFFGEFRTMWSGNTLEPPEPPEPPIRRSWRTRWPQGISQIPISPVFPSLPLLRYFFLRVTMSHALGAPRRNGRMLVPTPGVT